MYREEWCVENKDRMKRSWNKYYQENKEHYKQYRKDNKDNIKENWQKHYAQNKEQRSQYNKKYIEDNKEALKDKWAKSYQENKEYYKQYREDNKDKMKQRRSNIFVALVVKKLRCHVNQATLNLSFIKHMSKVFSMKTMINVII